VEDYYEEAAVPLFVQTK